MIYFFQFQRVKQRTEERMGEGSIWWVPKYSYPCLYHPILLHLLHKCNSPELDRPQRSKYLEREEGSISLHINHLECPINIYKHFYQSSKAVKNWTDSKNTLQSVSYGQSTNALLATACSGDNYHFFEQNSIKRIIHTNTGTTTYEETSESIN